MRKNNRMRYILCLAVLLIGVLSSGVRLKADETRHHEASQQPQTKPSIYLSSRKVEINLKRGRIQKISAKVFNAGQRKVLWSSSEESVVKVDQRGVVTGRKEGKAVVTARIEGTKVSTKCDVIVNNYKVMKMRTTGYCNCPRCSGPWAGHATASGRMPKANHTIAVDPRLIPLGTKVQIGNIIYTAEDTGSAIKGYRIDVYYSSHRNAQRHGVQYRMVRVFYR